MWADIKTNNSVLINRLDNSERILLKSVCDKSKEPFMIVKLDGVIDETGNFGGALVSVIENPIPYARELVIVMIKGDTRLIEFKFYDEDGHEITATLDEIYFTCKANINTTDVLFQYRLSNDGIVLGNDGFYRVNLVPSDTSNLTPGEYFFEITMVKFSSAPLMKQTSFGKLVLNPSSAVI